MYQTSGYNSNITVLRDFIIKIADKIVESNLNVNSRQFKIKQNFIPMYTLVYDYCNDKPSKEEKILKQYKNSLSYFIQAFVQFQGKQNKFRFTTENSKLVVRWFNKLWSKYTKFMDCIAKKIFPFLDRYFLPGQEQSSLQKVGLKLFQKNIFQESNKKVLFDSYFKEIKEIRSSKLMQNDGLLKFSKALAMNYPDLIIQFTKAFIKQSIDYYSEVFTKLSTTESVHYYPTIYNMFLFQKALVKMGVCLHDQDKWELFSEFSKALVEPYTSKFIEEPHGLQYAFQSKNTNLMRTIKNIYGRFQGFSEIREGYYNFILNQGQQLLKSLSTQQFKMAEAIYNFYKQQLNLLNLGFQDKKSQLLVSLNNAIQKLLLKKQSFTSNFYLYWKQLFDQKVFDKDDNKQKFTILFEKLPSKDEFINFYEVDLVKRMMGVDGQIDIVKEQNFINYLNQICGNEITDKLTKKITDYKEAPKQNEFRQYLPSNINFGICIISHYLWQKKFNEQLSFNLTLPLPLADLWTKIQQNYSQLQPKKRLNLIPLQNKLLLQMHCKTRKVLLKCSLIQASILLLMSTQQYTTQDDFIRSLSLQKILVQTTLQALQSHSDKLVLKTGSSDYSLAWDFVASSEILDLVEKNPEAKFISKAVQQDRQILIEAAVVKMMKKAKQAGFEEIVQKVTQAVRLFKPQPSKIKTAVEKLVKKSFLQTLEDGTLQYLE